MTTPHAHRDRSDEADVPPLGQTEAAPDETAFWDFFTTHVTPRLPPRPVMVALDWGRGRVRQTLRERMAQATLYGDDVPPAMWGPGLPLSETDAPPILLLPAVALPSLPLAPGTVHLVSLSAVLSRVADPVSVLAAVHRLLAPTGLLLLHDAIRRPRADACDAPQASWAEDAARTRQQGVRHMPVYPTDIPTDWQGLLHTANFAILRRGQVHPMYQLFVALPTGS
jgi:SAM-dependent methyltransferase